MTDEEIRDGWSSENRAELGLSYSLVLAALFLFLLNIGLVSLATTRSCRRRLSHGSTDKNLEGVIMLY